MDLIYLIVSSDSFTIQRRIEEIASKNPQATIVHYDLREVPIERAIEDLDTCNFFEQEKIVVCEQAFFLSTEKKRGAIEHNLESLEKYVTHPNPDNRLVLVTDSLDKRKKIVSLCLAHTTLLEGEVSFQEYIRKHLDGYIIDKDTLTFFTEYCGVDSGKLLMEWEKLKLYCLDTKKITISDIKKVVSKNVDDNIFTFIDDLLSGKKKEAFEIYQDLLLHGEQVASILSKLANKIRLFYQVKILLKMGKSDQEIAKTLGVHPYPVKLAREASFRYPESLLLSYLSKLHTIDLEMKSGKCSDSVIFEMMMASL